jgi:ferredoxin
MGIGLKLLTTLLEQGQIEVDATRCLHAWYKESSCTKCTAVCPEEKAISFGKGELELLSNHCQECMNCVAVCPTGAFWDRKTVERYDSIRKRSRVIFACNRQGNNQQHVLFFCLQQLKPVHLLFSADHSESVNIILNETECRTCPLFHVEVLEYVHSLVNYINKLIQSKHQEVRLIDRESMGLDSSSSMEMLTRKQLFEILRKKTVSSTIESLIPTIVKGIRKGKLSAHLDEQLLVSLLAKYECTNAEITGNLFNKVKVNVNNHCNGCGKCSLFCPTGSLTSDIKGNIFNLSQRIDDCVNCELCREICPKQAICYEYEFFLAELKIKSTRIEIYIDKCPTCGKSVVKGEICPECSKKRRLEVDINEFFS